MTEMNKAGMFDLLDYLAELGKERLEEHHSTTNVNILKELIFELNDEMVITDDITPSVFAEYVYQLRRIKRTWSRKLGETILAASEKKAQGDLNGAILIFEQFVKECPSTFYKNIAITQIGNYRESMNERDNGI